MAVKKTDEGWEKELMKIINEQEKELKSLIRKRKLGEEREAEMVGVIEEIIEDRGRQFMDLIKPSEELRIASAPVMEKRPHEAVIAPAGTNCLTPPMEKKDNYPHTYDIEIVMPEMTDVAAVNLLFRTEIHLEREPETNEGYFKAILKIYHKYSDSRVEVKVSLELPDGEIVKKEVDAFVRDAITTFTESWYKRKIGEEKDRERDYDIRILSTVKSSTES